MMLAQGAFAGNLHPPEDGMPIFFLHRRPAAFSIPVSKRACWMGEREHAMRGKQLFVGAAILFGFISSVSHAATWSEVGDAGDTPGTSQATVGPGSLTQISGTLPGTYDIDMYQIDVVDHANFSATMTPLFALLDPDLWLFDSAGNGIGLDDSVHGGVAQITGALVPSNGLYYLVVSSDGADALSAGGKIWNSPIVTGQRAPDGPGAGQPFIGWGGSPMNDDVTSYTVYLNGADPVLAPEPVSLSLMALGSMALSRRRSR